MSAGDERPADGIRADDESGERLTDFGGDAGCDRIQSVRTPSSVTISSTRSSGVAS